MPMEEGVNELKVRLISRPTYKPAIKAKSGDAVVAEIHLGKTPHSYFMDLTFCGKPGEIVPRLVEDWA